MSSPENTVEVTLRARQVDVGLIDDPDSEHWIPTVVFTLDNEQSPEIAVQIPNLDVMFGMIQQLMTIVLDDEGMDEMGDLIVRRVGIMRENGRLPFMVEKANNKDEDDPEITVRAVRKFHDD